MPTGEVLKFAMAHAAARDAVHSELEIDRLEEELRPLGEPVLRLETAAVDRMTYLGRPDLGRRLGDESRRLLAERAQAEPVDVALIVGDGLSAVAAQKHAAALLALLVPRLREAGLRIGPITIVRHARVAVQDEIGERLHAAAAAILIGERPGLSAADSLGAYLVHGPRPGRTDAQRNCVSNIRPEGLPLEAAAQTIAHLLRESLRRKLSGIELKDNFAALTAGERRAIGP